MTPETKQTETITDSLHDSPMTPLQEETGFHTVKALATPSVRKMAMENKVNIIDVTGSGKDGRILKDDIVAFLEQLASKKSSSSPAKSLKPPSPPPSSPSLPTQVQYSPKTTVQNLTSDKKEPIKGVKKAMVKTMTTANNIPHFSYCDEYDMNSLVNLKYQLKKLAKERGVESISFLPIIIKACSVALHSYPILNAHVDEKCDNITYKASHNIGVAIDTKDGLIVPNIKNVETKSIFEIANDLLRLQNLAMSSKLAPNDLMGGTFTLSNIGSIGGTYMKPIILPPEVAIGALGRIQKLPRFDRDEKLIVSNVMQVSWSADHRVIDGATMARFSNLVRNYLENLSVLMMDLK